MNKMPVKVLLALVTDYTVSQRRTLKIWDKSSFNTTPYFDGTAPFFRYADIWYQGILTGALSFLV